ENSGRRPSNRLQRHPIARSHASSREEHEMRRHRLCSEIRCMTFVVIGLMLAAGGASAQIIQAVNPTANPGEPEGKTTNATAPSPGMNLLTQASVNSSGSDSMQVGLEAIDLWMNKFARLYVRLTLPVKTQAAVTSDATASTGASVAASTTNGKPDDTIVKQL